MSLIRRFRGMPARTKLFAVLAILLPLLAILGVLRSDRDVEISRERAVEIARPHIDFEPIDANARVFRQGARLRPVWAVSFSIPATGNAREFERHTTVEVDAVTGEVLRIAVDNFEEQTADE